MTGPRGARARPSYANVTASLALFVALGGTAAAAVTLPRDSVGAQQIRTDAVRSPEIAKDAVRSPEIVKDAVGSPEIKAGAVRSSEIEDNGVRLADVSDSARSARQGAQGPAGPQGPSGTTSVRLAEAAFLEVPRCTGFIDLRVCPPPWCQRRRFPPGTGWCRPSSESAATRPAPSGCPTDVDSSRDHPSRTTRRFTTRTRPCLPTGRSAARTSR